jgi:hypothetical protein
VHLQTAVVLDESELREFVHDEVDARARRPDSAWVSLEIFGIR